ncbi:DsrE family protein [Novipirellula sp.]|uniref:DsrE family protein n=1 Tax=Novipirellula sp. TaxID=2795430 RepID=UPI00356449A7
MKTTIAAVALTLFLVSSTAGAGDPTGDPRYEHPVVKDHGGVVVLPNAAYQPKRSAKVILDITSDQMEGGVLLGLDRAALILNQYTAADAGTEHDFNMTVILHGPATIAALADEAFAKHVSSYKKDLGKAKNPNREIVKTLTNAGVEIVVCGQALAHHGFATDEVLSEVKVAVSAATANIQLQMSGYAYIPFK